jgi:hypothetical protein
MRKRKQTPRQKSSKHNSAKTFEYGKPKTGGVINDGTGLGCFLCKSDAF